MMRYFSPTAIRQFTAFVLFIGLWEFFSGRGILNPFFIPPPSAIADVLYQFFARGTIWPHMEATFTAALLGLILGLVIGTLLGFMAALIPFLSELLEPIMVLFNAIPRVIVAPLFIAWFGIGLESKIAVAFLLVAVVTFFAVYSGIKEVDKRLIERVRTLGGGTHVLIREVYLPSVTTWLLGNLKIAVGFAFTGAVVGEFLAATRGLGYLLTFAQSTYNVAQVFAIIILVMTVVLLLFGLAGWLEKRLLRWRYR